jgi:hypothetical protein
MAYGLLAIAPVLMLMILAGSFLIFFLLPRVSSRFLSAYTPTSDVSTGFSDHVQLGRIGQIQQSSAVVMHIEIENDPQGAYDLKWRGIALSTLTAAPGRIPSTRLNCGRRRWKLSAGAFEWPRRIDGGGAIHSLSRFDGAARNQRVFPGGKTAAPDRETFRQVSMDSGGAVYNLDADHPINRYEAESQLAEPDRGPSPGAEPRPRRHDPRSI